MWQKLDATQKAEYESKTPSTNASNKSCLKIATQCSPKDIKDTINVLSDEKKAAIEEMGFVSLLEMKCGKLSHSMCRFLVDKLNLAKSSIVLHGKTLKISVDDFVGIMGVKDGGEEVDFTGSMDDQHIVNKERTLHTPCRHEHEVKLNKEDDNMFDMWCDGGQEDLGNNKPPKSRPNKEDETPNKQDDNVKGFATVDTTLAPSVEVIHERKHAKQPQNEI
ncbi:unnamed protein product [Prunus brigantina]